MSDSVGTDGRGRLLIAGSPQTAPPYTAGKAAVSQALSRITVREDQLITLLGLVREYTTDRELYNLLAEARP